MSGKKARSLPERVLASYALRVCQAVFNGPIYLTQWLWDLGSHAAQDGHEWQWGVEVTKSKYSNGDLTLLRPSGLRGAPAGYVMYVHGGGFCCTTFFHYKQSLTFLVRAGFIVIGVDYPQSPQVSFPEPQLAVVRAVRAANVLFPDIGEAGLHLIGDSAGGNLVLQAALLLTCRESLLGINRAAASGWMPPPIHGVVSVYGMLDREDSLRKAALPLSLGLQFLWRAHAGDNVGEDKGTEPRDLRPAFADTLRELSASFDGELQDFPRCLLVVGANDFLLPSSTLVDARLKELGVASQLKVYPGNHAFWGLPPGWMLGTCWTNSIPCSRTILDFVRGSDNAETPLAEFVSGRLKIPLIEPLAAGAILLQVTVLLPLLVLLGPAALIVVACRFGATTMTVLQQ